MSTMLNRTTFETSRQLEYFNERELTAQTGHVRSVWPEMIGKELLDNGLDAAETVGQAPVVQLQITDATITVSDNGPGIPLDTITRAMDYSVRVSDKAKYIS